MSNAKETMLAAVRSALGRSGRACASAVSEDYATALGGPNPRPTWSQTRIGRFTERLEKAAATWERVPARNAVPAAIARYLGESGVPALRLAPQPEITAIEWPTDWEITAGVEGAAEAPVVVARAYAGIADTGSLVMPSSAERPATLNFLPDVHILVLAEEEVVDYMEEIWERILGEQGRLPRTVNVITGPSRTADVEQTLQLGAHGPRRLHILLLG